MNINIHNSTKFFLLFLLSGVCHLSFANVTPADSLRNLLQNPISDSTRVEVLNTLSNELKSIKWKEALECSNQALELSRKIGHKTAEIEAIFNVGILSYYNIDRDAARTYFEEGAQMANEVGYWKLASKHLIELGQWHRYRSRDSVKVVESFLKSIEVGKKINSYRSIGEAYGKLACFYAQKQDYELCKRSIDMCIENYLLVEDNNAIAHHYNKVGKRIWAFAPYRAMKFYFKGLEYSQDNPNLKASLGKAYNTIGKTEEALEYLKSAVSGYDKHTEAEHLGFALTCLAETYIQINDYEAAERICNQTIEFLEPLGNQQKKALPSAYTIKGIIKEHQGKPEEALEYYQKSLDVSPEVGVYYNSAESRLSIAKFYVDSDISKTKALCNEALKISQEFDYVTLQVDAYEHLYNINKNEEKYQSALKNYEQKTFLGDSLNALKVKHTLDIYEKLAADKYQQEIHNQKLESQITLNRVLGLSTLVGLIFIGFLGVGIKRIASQKKEIIRKKEDLKIINENLRYSNQELERFAAITSHDLKTPLKSILGFTGLLKRKLGKLEDSFVQDSLNFIEKAGQTMSKLIEDILAHSKVSGSKTNLSKEVINLNDLVKEISKLVINPLEESSKTIEVSALPIITWNHSKIFLLFKNIIENGLKYNKSAKPTVKIHSNKNDAGYSIYIEDNGIGIEKEHFEDVFTMFRRLHNQNEFEGTGLGLATCKKITDEFKGNVHIESEVGKGSIFRIDIPDSIIHNPDQVFIPGKVLDNEVPVEIQKNDPV